MVGMEGENLVFIFSLPRSGSTLLGAILGNHTKTLCPPEPWFLLRLAEVRGGRSSEKIYDDYFAGVATEAFLSEEAFLESARAFAVQAYNHRLKRACKEIFIDKTPRYYHILRFIERLFPKSKKIWLKRNPLDVAASYKKTWSIGIEALIGKRIIPASFDFILGLPAFVDFFQNDVDAKYEVKYEDIVCDTKDEIERICSFMGIPFEETMLDYGTNQDLMATLENAVVGDRQILEHQCVHQNSAGAWLNALSRKEVDRLIGVIGTDVLRQAGYPETAEMIEESILAEGNEGGLDKIRRNMLDRLDERLLSEEIVDDMKRVTELKKAFEAKRLDVADELRKELEASSKYDIRKLRLKEMLYFWLRQRLVK